MPSGLRGFERKGGLGTEEVLTFCFGYRNAPGPCDLERKGVGAGKRFCGRAGSGLHLIMRSRRRRTQLRGGPPDTVTPPPPPPSPSPPPPSPPRAARLVSGAPACLS